MIITNSSLSVLNPQSAINTRISDAERARNAPATPFDGLPVPGGRKLGSVEHPARELISYGVSGADHTKGRNDNFEAYAKHLQSIFDAGGKKAIDDWLATQTPRSEK